MNFPIDFKLDDEFRRRQRQQTKQERLNLERLIEEDGCKDDALTVALIGSEKILCDGYNTLAICNEKGIAPTPARCKVFKDRADVLEWIDRNQKGRRNLTAEEMAQNRAERIERVVEARADGKSIRAIAAEEKVAVNTIQKDLDKAGVLPSTPEKKVTGKDGKNYDAQKPLPRCDRCARIYKGSDKSEPDCPQCEILRGKQTTKPRPSNAKQTQHQAQVSADPGPEVPKTKPCPHCKGTGRIVGKGFRKPSVEEVRAYCLERANHVDAEQFVDHYESNGWRVGKAAMKDWQAAIRTWEKNNMNGNGKLAPNAAREHAILMGWYKPSSGEPFDPKVHCEKP